MVRKSITDNIFKAVRSGLAAGVSAANLVEGMGEQDGQVRGEAFATKDIISAIASWAGKGKDEVVQMLCREVGQAVAAMIKEPLTQVIENRKLKITLELVPRDTKELKSKATVKRKTRKSSKRL